MQALTRPRQARNQDFGGARGTVTQMNGGIFNVRMGDLDAICRRWRIRRLRAFGSCVTGDPRPDSDVDLLVEFEPGCTPGLAIIDLEVELSTLFDRPVDLVNPKYLYPRLKGQIERSATVLYAA